jgi:hypothetical protein
MKTPIALVALALTWPLVACGPSEPAKSAEGGGHEAQHEHEHGAGHHEERGDHHGAAGAVKAFHDVLAPVYHAEKNPARTEQACGAVPSFKERGAAVGTEAGNDAKKKAAAEALVGAVGNLEKACAESGRAQVDPSLEKVHDAFHAVVEKK